MYIVISAVFTLVRVVQSLQGLCILGTPRDRFRASINFEDRFLVINFRIVAKKAPRNLKTALRCIVLSCVMWLTLYVVRVPPASDATQHFIL